MRRALPLLLIACASCKGIGKHRASKDGSNTIAAPTPDELDEAALAARPKLTPTGKGLEPGQYKVVRVRAEAEPKKSATKPWDPEPETRPDLRIDVNLDGVRVGDCRTDDDALAGECRIDEVVEIAADSVFEINVVDRDAFADDQIGTATLSDPSRWDVDMSLPMAPTADGRVHSASIELQTYRSPHYYRFVGLGLGVVGAIAILGGFRKQLFAVDKPPRKARCPHCEKLIALDAMKCDHCGARQ